MQLKHLIFRLFISVALMPIFEKAFCQENYTPGYIIQLNGDTLLGFVDYQNWKSNPENIFFKVSLIDNKAGYSYSDIKGFGVTGDAYLSAIIDREEMPNVLNTNDHNSILSTLVDTVFLQILIQGPKSLYYYTNNLGSTQFYIRQDSTCELLISKKYLVSKNEIEAIAENRLYISQLSAYLNDCPSIFSKLSSTIYSQRSLEDLFQFYYKCTGMKVKFLKKPENLSAEFGLLIGMAITSIKFNATDDYKYLNDAEFTKSANFSAGLSLNIILPRQLSKYSIYNELMFTSFKSNGEYVNYYHENSYVVFNSTLGASNLQLNNLLRYTFPVSKAKTYLNAGISNEYSFNFTNTRIVEVKYYTSTTYYNYKALEKPAKYEIGLLLGAGASFRNISFEIRFERASGISNQKDLSSSANRYFFNWGYKF